MVKPIASDEVIYYSKEELVRPLIFC